MCPSMTRSVPCVCQRERAGVRTHALVHSMWPAGRGGGLAGASVPVRRRSRRRAQRGTGRAGLAVLGLRLRRRQGHPGYDRCRPSAAGNQGTRRHSCTPRPLLPWGIPPAPSALGANSHKLSRKATPSSPPDLWEQRRGSIKSDLRFSRCCRMVRAGKPSIPRSASPLRPCVRSSHISGQNPGPSPFSHPSIQASVPCRSVWVLCAPRSVLHPSIQASISCLLHVGTVCTALSLPSIHPHIHSVPAPCGYSVHHAKFSIHPSIQASIQAFIPGLRCPGSVQGQWVGHGPSSGRIRIPFQVLRRCRGSEDWLPLPPGAGAARHPGARTFLSDVGSCSWLLRSCSVSRLHSDLGFKDGPRLPPGPTLVTMVTALSQVSREEAWEQRLDTSPPVPAPQKAHRPPLPARRPPDRGPPRAPHCTRDADSRVGTGRAPTTPGHEGPRG